MEIHFFEDAEGWAVHAAGSTRRFASRRDAFAEAGRLARQNAPATVVRGAPTGHESGGVRESRGGHDASDGRDPIGGRGNRGGGATDLGGEASTGRGQDPPVVEAAVPPRGDRDPTEPPVLAPQRPDRTRAANRGLGVGDTEATGRRRARVRDAGLPDWERLAGPPQLGRSLLVPPGGEVAGPWSGAARVAVAEALGTPGFLDRVRASYLSRERVVYELAADASSPMEALPTLDVWSLDPDAELESEAAWQLLTANAVDARDPDAPLWPWGEAAIEAGGTPAGTTHPDGTDVVLPDGRGAVCDGGPLRFWTSGELGLDEEVVVLTGVSIDHGVLDPPGHAAPAAALAPDQLAAVAEATACSRIVAPAGSGKTRVLTERARHLLAERRVPPAALCLVAFNKRAQLEMVERTPDLPGLQVQTLNALALAVLNGGRGFRDRGERVRTIDEPDVRRRLDDLVTFPRRANTDPAAAWIDALSAVRLGLRDPAKVEGDFDGDVEGFAEVFGRYRASLRRDGVVDFDDQIYRAIEVLLAEPDTRHQARRNCRLLLVDEFQDLTPAHLLLVRLLAGPELDVFGVGDDDQTIYGYSGASPDWLVAYDRWFPGATHHALEVNYRSPAPVVAAATNLLSHNRRRVPKTITAGPGAVTASASLTVVADADPTRAAVDRVTRLVADGVAPAHIAVLSRVNTLLAPVQVGLHEADIPCSNREGTRFLERTGVAAALSWLALATGSGGFASAHIERAARRPGRGISPRLISWMAEQRDVAGLTRLAERLTTERDADKVLGFAGDLERIVRRARSDDTASLVGHIRTSLGLDTSLRTLDAAHRGRNATAHTDDLRALAALGRLHPDPADFGSWLRGVLAHPPDPNGVQLAPVHRVKGLEWPHVVVCDATDGVFPHRLSTDVEEERRVFHVAITRGSASVWVVADEDAPSIFVDEMATPAPPDASPANGEGAATGTGRTPGTARRRDRGTGPEELPAVVGTALHWGGYDVTVAEVGDDGVKLSTGRATISVAFGSEVEVDGRRRRLVAPQAKGKGARVAVDTSDADPTVLEALKAWRRTRSKADNVPAYVVAPDKTLAAIASALPRSEADLLRIPGIGPAKLERYGDEVLAVVDGAAPP